MAEHVRRPPYLAESQRPIPKLHTVFLIASSEIRADLWGRLDHQQKLQSTALNQASRQISVEKCAT